MRPGISTNGGRDRVVGGVEEPGTSVLCVQVATVMFSSTDCARCPSELDR